MPALHFDRASLIEFKRYAVRIFAAARAAAQAQPGTLGLKKRELMIVMSTQKLLAFESSGSGQYSVMQD
jgi:hypothetical protein